MYIRASYIAKYKRIIEICDHLWENRPSPRIK